MFKPALSILTLLLLLSTLSNAEKTAKFRDGSSRFSNNFFSNFSLFTKNDSVYVDMMVIKPLIAGFKVNLDCQLRLDNSKAYQSLFAYTLDVCSVIISFKDTIFKKLFKSLLKYGNFMQNCPVTNGHYYLNGWQVDPKLIPQFLHPGDYRIKGYGFMGKYKTKSEQFVVEVVLSTLVEDV